MAFWVLLLLQAVVASASAVPLSTKEHRRSATDFVDVMLNTLVENFEKSIPVASENGALLLKQLLSPLVDEPYRITQQSANSTARAEALHTVRENFIYTTLSTGGPLYPGGELGVAKNALDVANMTTDITLPLLAAKADGKQAITDAANYSGLQTLEDYVKLYTGEWLNSLPNGTDLGILTNYTQDLLFSMQRLSSSPYQVRRLRFGSESLPFAVDDSITNAITGMSIEQLYLEGRLFYADYRDQLGLESTGRYSAACEAYFYIDASSGKFLPLAIRTNVGSNLVYTPLDSTNDWLLAKIMFNVNDFWFSQWNHLAATHFVMQIVWAAAIRTLSREHPLFAVLNRLTYEAYSLPLLAEGFLFFSGGAVDLVFPFTGSEANNYTNRLYSSKAGRFQSNYFETDLKSRGLIGPCQGPPIEHFPFHEDARIVYTATRQFMSSFVKSYYSSNGQVAADAEIQAWVAECMGDAQVIDFPSEIKTIDSLVDVLTHVSMLALMNEETRAANDVFMMKMKKFSSQLQARGFDENGLSQGMPFIWKALDPNVAPFSITI
ncbi:arachidonate 8-lipoxygenase [Grosmannia clavigera kw1407]|uniref:Manganese lipoxygenase n=1 Tax=Grosmannia clavigera (strain kw1407 / UAMH 11150) TaxID=655863 RepID=F0XMU0_GROCL|nr:arachidonate 8-lipoxygenase [Grosmannia clavigera kw1407]EFX01408.1 arachidonate 8-lipoxygenase [Grosmannia clavigera kw1407]